MTIRMKPCIGRLAVAAAFAMLAFVPGLARAETETQPTLVSPTNGSSFRADSPPRFVVDDGPPAEIHDWMAVSTSPTLSGEGLQGALGRDSGFWPMSPEGSTWSIQPQGGLNYQWSPGTYYWQAKREKCQVQPPVCSELLVYSVVWRFTVEPTPPPEHAGPALRTSVQSGTPAPSQTEETPHARATPPHTSGKAPTHPRCVTARIAGHIKCLKPGEFCSWRYRQQYRRYHFACIPKGRYFRLVRQR